ncbi:hypothetical protein Rwratislav_28508 [Rhodococcus wratislaviensis IFP 2016]|nr:hypothetical protein Rwratislav_28508 [Rhodococcus wratislaviensis IFP 2016]
MTATDAPESAALPEPELGETREWFATPDLHLQQIAYYAEELGVSIPLTLYLPWGVVAGSTVAASKFFEHHASIARAQSENPSAKFVADDILQPIADRYTELQGKERDSEELKKLLERQSYLTLTDVVCSLQNGPAASPMTANTPYQHPFLRVRLTQVTGWSIGAVTFNS